MKLFQEIFQKEKKKHDLGVCIPDANRRKKELKAEKVIPASHSFIVSGLFHVHDSLMIKGMSGGTIRKKDKAKFNSQKFEVTGIQIENKETDLIEKGQTGALFLDTSKGKIPNIKIGDELEF